MIHLLTAALFMAMVAESDRNTANLIKDVRKELNAPKLPFVIVHMGQLGPETKGDVAALCEIQMGMGDPKKHPGFMGIVASVETRTFARPAKESPSDFEYHWNHSGKAMLELVKNKSAGKGDLR